MDDDLLVPRFLSKNPIVDKKLFFLPESVKLEQRISVFYSVMYMFCSMAKERKSYPQ